LWSETILPGIVPEDSNLYSFAKKLVVFALGFNIFGLFYNEGKEKIFSVALDFKGADNYNSVHKKNHLVTFGEFIPFRKFLVSFFCILIKWKMLTKVVMQMFLTAASCLLAYYMF
jgi:apolipoprotein N-acyltransferase